jgi:hypothetical protein
MRVGRVSRRLLGAVVGALLMLSCSDTTGSPVTSPSSDPEEAVGASPPATTAKLPLVKGHPVCGSPTAHIYSPDRLKLLAACVTVKGTIAIIRVEKDGDLHVLLRLDAGESKYINARNVSGESGYLVLEPVCVRPPTQLDAIPACAGYINRLPIPAVGVHVSVTGAWVLDLDHGWLELHPVFAFNGVGAPVSKTSPPAKAVNLCGAPANPWRYGFCGSHLITAPASAFCSYFACISSFANGLGYVVQCGDGKYSKSGGRTGVCSQHGSFKRNLYSP